MIGSANLQKLEQFCLNIKKGFNKIDAYKIVYYDINPDELDSESKLSYHDKITISQNAYLLTNTPAYASMMRTIEAEMKKEKSDNKYEHLMNDVVVDDKEEFKDYTMEEATKDLRKIIKGCRRDIEIIDEGFEFEQNALHMELTALLEKGERITKEEQKRITMLQRSWAKSLKTNKRNEKYYEIIGNTIGQLCKMYGLQVEDDKNKTVEVVFKDVQLED